jgi:NADP-dependent 3-hydroxy acid dehydrogenase YdfG/Tfp pilus assembly protein PilF
MASFILTYSIENQDTAQKFASDLSTVGAKFQHFIVDEKNDLNALRSFREPIIAFVSDNFLKNRYCLRGAIHVFSDLAKTGQLLVLITAGKHVSADGTVKIVPTQFERVSNVIQYMNFWQDQYLDARKAHNHKEISDAELSDVRDISNQIGDFIRLLREANNKSLETAVAANYLQFCLLFGLPQPSQVSDFQFAELVARPIPPPVVMPEIAPSFEPEISNSHEAIPDMITTTFAPEVEEIVEKVEEQSTAVEIPAIVETQITEEVIEEIIPTEIIKEKTEQMIDIQLVVKDNNFFDNSEDEQEDSDIEDILANMPGLGQLENRPKLENTAKNHLLEIDEDDFFNPAPKDPSSNVNEIIAEVIDEENEDEDGDYEVEKNGNLDDIFDENEDQNDDDDDDFIDDILRGKNPAPKVEEIASAASSSDDHSEISESVSEVTNVVSTENEEKIEESIPSENAIQEIVEENKIESEVADNQEVTEEESIALGQLKSDVNADPENIKTRLRYAVGLAKLQNNWQAATKEVEIVLEKDPYNPSALLLLGEMCEVNGDFLSAIEYYKKVEKISPYYPNICKKLADLMSVHTQDKDTKKYFKKAIELEENNAELTYAYATFLLENQKNPEKALKYFKKTLKIDENHLFANYDIALIYHALGDPYAAKRFYENACANNAEIKTDDNDNVFKIESILSEERAEEAIYSGAEDPELVKFNEMIDEAEGEKIVENTEIETKIEIDEVGKAATMAAAVTAAIAVSPFTNIEETSFNEDMLSAVNETEVIEVMSSKKDKSKPNPAAKIALITGASSGIGKATAELLAKDGYNLILTGRRKERLVEMEEEFNQSYSGSTIVLAFDVSKSDQVEEAIQTLDNEWVNIDILLNNAGLGLGLHPIHEGVLEHWDTMIDTNIKGLLYMTRMIAPKMVEKRSGHIINLCSTAGKEAYANGNVYCATKFAVEALTKSMRIDLHKHNIRVSQVSPGAVNETEFSLVRFDGDTKRADKVYEGFQPISASDVADVIQFIISRPAHVNIQDVLLMSTQQATATMIDRK